MEVNNSGYQSIQASLAYKKFEFQGQMEINGQTVDANISIEQLSFQFQMESSGFSSQNALGQGAVFDFSKIGELLDQIDTDKIGYTGTPFNELSQGEAADLVADGGFFSIEETAQRVANFVIQGSGGDAEMLKAGREGALQGFKEAESLWGGKLPDISYQTMERINELLDEAFQEAGVPLLNQEA